MVKKTTNLKYYEGVGRRKEAVARVRLYLVNKDKTANVNGIKIKQGEIYVNTKIIEAVFPSEIEKILIQSPLKLTNSDDRFAVNILVRGGGRAGQIDAILNGTARALVKVDNDAYRPTLKAKGLLTRDARVRERRKVGTGGKARRQKQSPKR